MGETMKGPRNSAIELYRVVLMGGIILLHITGFQEFWADWRHLTFLLLPCVDGFVLITGYFGTKFSLRKLCKLYATALWCIVLVSLLYHLIVGDLGVRVFAKDVLAIFKEFWFLHSYAFLLCFAPLVNLVFERCDKREQLKLFLPICAVIFGWGLFLGLKGVHHLTPDMPGLTAKSGLTLLGVYIVGRLYRVNETCFDAVPLWCWILGLFCLGAICTVGMGWFGTYNSPFAVLFALSFLHLFKKIQCPNWLSAILSWISASVFPVYILHANELSFEGMRCIIKNLYINGLPLSLSMILTLFIVYVSSIALDLPRRALLRFFP
jgi:surface polysaccharide O-acyltransferase-like enzyme